MCYRIVQKVDAVSNGLDGIVQGCPFTASVLSSLTKVELVNVKIVLSDGQTCQPEISLEYLTPTL